jgi:hypothetical protein
MNRGIQFMANLFCIFLHLFATSVMNYACLYIHYNFFIFLVVKWNSSVVVFTSTTTYLAYNHSTYKLSMKYFISQLSNNKHADDAKFWVMIDRLKSERSLYLSKDLNDQLHAPVALPSRKESPVPIE